MPPTTQYLAVARQIVEEIAFGNGGYTSADLVSLIAAILAESAPAPPSEPGEGELRRAATDMLAALKDAYATFYDQQCELGKQVSAAIASGESALTPKVPNP